MLVNGVPCINGDCTQPDALGRKYPRAGASWNWFRVFPQDTHSLDPRPEVVRRLHPSQVHHHPKVNGSPQAFFLAV